MDATTLGVAHHSRGNRTRGFIEEPQGRGLTKRGRPWAASLLRDSNEPSEERSRAECCSSASSVPNRRRSSNRSRRRRHRARSSIEVGGFLTPLSGATIVRSRRAHAEGGGLPSQAPTRVECQQRAQNHERPCTQGQPRDTVPCAQGLNEIPSMLPDGPFGSTNRWLGRALPDFD